MMDRVLNSGLFAGLAAGFGLILAYVLLKTFKVAKPLEHKAFIPIMGAGMLLAYILRAFARTMR